MRRTLETKCSLVDRLGLGTVQFGQPYGVTNVHGQVSIAESKSILKLARSANIDTLDTAIAYGTSEARLGDIGVDQFNVVTKLPPIPGGVQDAKKWICDHVYGSCKRLASSSVYGLLLHRSRDLSGPFGTQISNTLTMLKAEGTIEKAGISIYSPDEIAPAMEGFDIDIVQAPLSVVDRRLISSGWLEALSRNSVEVHTRSAFLQGLLLVRRGCLPNRFGRWSDVWHQWWKYLESANLHAISASLLFPLSHPEIDRVIVGVESADQLRELIDAANCSSFPDEWPEISCIDEALIDPARWNAL